MIVHTADKLEAFRRRADLGDTLLVDELLREVERLTDLVTVVEAARSFDRFHAFDGIRDDCCPACNGRVRVDESDPSRLRIISDQRVRAS